MTVMHQGVNIIRLSAFMCTWIFWCSQKMLSHNIHNKVMFIYIYIYIYIWIKRDQLDVTCFIISLFNAQQVSDVNTSILRSLQVMCWVILWVVLIWFDVCWCYVVVWLWWCGIRMHTDTTPPQPNHNVIPTNNEPEQCNPWNNSTNKLQAPEDGCINIWNMLSIKQRNNKASDIKLLSLYSAIKMMHGPINIRFTTSKHQTQTTT